MYCGTQSSMYLSSVLLGCIPVWTYTHPKPTPPYNKANTAHITHLNNSVKKKCMENNKQKQLKKLQIIYDLIFYVSNRKSRPEYIRESGMLLVTKTGILMSQLDNFHQSNTQWASGQPSFL